MFKSIVRMLRGSALILTMAAVAILGASCYPNAPEDAEEFDVVVTFRDIDTDFGVDSTFALIDTIAHLEIPGAENRDISRDYDKDIRDLVRQKFTERGYTEVDESADPNMVVLIGAAATTEYDPYQSEPWFNYWGAIFEDSLDANIGVTWGLDYSWYTGSVVYAYDVGALLVAVIDPEGIDTISEGEKIPMLWLGTFNGILSGNDVSIVRRVEEAINQMFKQSPYLTRNPD